MRIFQMLLMLLKPTYKGNNMKHSLSYSQLNKIDQAAEIKKENRMGIIAAVVLFSLYCMASTMEYNDCLKGLC